MTITPDHGNSVVALGVNVCWMDIFRDSLNLEDLSAIYFIDAARATTSQSQVVWRYLFDKLSCLIDIDNSLLRIELNLWLRSNLINVFNFVNNFMSQ